MLVAGRAFFVGPGCFVCPWAAARPRAVRAASFARRIVSKPGQAPPPPTGTAARPQRVVQTVREIPPPPTGTAARPTNPSGALHTGGAFGAVWCRPGPATHRHRAQASRPAPHPSFLSPQPISHAIPPRLFQTFNLDRWNCNVFRLCWNFSQSNCMRLFGGRLQTPPRAPQPGPHPRLGHTSAKKLALLASISVHTRKSSPSTATTAQNQPIFTRRANFFAVWPEIDSCWASFFALMGATAASQHPPTTSPETDDTNAGGSLPRNETTDTFARTKEPISGRFPPAKVSRVSCTPHRAPAKASLVSSDVESRLLIHSKALRRSCLLPPSQSW